MYMGLVCVILFDARGDKAPDMYGPATLAIAALILAMKHMPAILHRPHRIDSFCEDLLHISSHASCVAMLPPGHNHLRYACTLHSAYFLLQHRFLKGTRSVFLHTVALVWLACAYVYGPRVSELKIFIAAVVCPHVLDAAASLVTQIHRFLTVFLIEC